MPRWTEEARARQRDVIMKAEPWKKSTGPKTPEGKEKSSGNALKHCMRTKATETLLRIMAENNRYRRSVMEDHTYRYKKAKADLGSLNEGLRHHALKERGVEQKEILSALNQVINARE